MELINESLEKFRSTPLPAVMIIAVAVVLLIICLSVRNTVNSRIKRKLKHGSLIYYQDFERDWIKEKGSSGYKYNDTPGCYVITLYDHKLIGRHGYMNYDNIYIGQSQNVCQRVHNHLTGKGKGDVYADIKYGLEAYITIIPCKEKKMNEMERQLIEAFNATESYNKTKGGGIER